MNCFNHTQEPAVAQCSDCGKGLCPECAERYQPILCTPCFQKRKRSEIWRSIFSLLFLIALFVIGFRWNFLATKKYGWTKDVLIHKIELKTYESFLLGQSNFDTTLPENIRNQAVLAVKDEYMLDFIGLGEEHSEYELEQAIIKNIRSFLMEFGTDFSFMGNQYRLEVDGREYFIDLLLYNRRLQAMIAVELKIGEFKPEYKGKMEFYLNILNETVKLPHENPAIGIIICKSKSRTIVEYALKTSAMPIGVATYNLSPELPEAYKELLPTSEDIAKKLEVLIKE